MDQKQYKKKQKIELPIVFQTKEDIFDLKVRKQEQTRRLLKISIWDQLSIFHPPARGLIKMFQYLNQNYQLRCNEIGRSEYSYSNKEFLT